MEKGKFTYKLPEGWFEVEIKDISLKINYGFTAKSVLNNTGTKFLRITDIQDNHVNWNSVPYCEIDVFDKPKFILKKEDIVFARTGATVGKSYLIGDNIPSAVFASYLIRIQLSTLIDPKFVYYYFQSGDYWKQIGVKALGVGQPHVNANALSRLKLPLPSKVNQHIIVSKIESLFSELDQAEKGLQKAKQQLEVYRQALLKNAFEGKLTERWRNLNQDFDAFKELTDIKRKRKAKYEIQIQEGTK
jgi:type I restriction enzyme S subunit